MADERLITIYDDNGNKIDDDQNAGDAVSFSNTPREAKLVFKDNKEYSLFTGIPDVAELAQNYTSNNIYYKLLKEKGIKDGLNEFIDIFFGKENLDNFVFDMSVRQYKVYNTFVPWIHELLWGITPEGVNYRSYSHGEIIGSILDDNDNLFEAEYIMQYVWATLTWILDECTFIEDEKRIDDVLQVLGFVLTVCDYTLKYAVSSHNIIAYGLISELSFNCGDNDPDVILELAPAEK